MRHNVEDLKNRALVESNILKQFILSATAKKRGEFKPQLDDILIHDYQMANSVTLNVILSNYMVDLAYAIDCIQNPLYEGLKDSYFKLVRDMDETSNNLPDQTRLVLDVANGDGTFKTRELVLDMKELWNQNERVGEFFNLDSIWYCRKVVYDQERGEDHDTIEIVKEMNNFHQNANPFGGNPFDKTLYWAEGGAERTFNQWLVKLNCIIENRFYKNVMEDDGAQEEPSKFGQMISKCRYLLCVEGYTSGGLYGLQESWGTDQHGNRVFSGFVLHDIGSMLPILGKDFAFEFCSFHILRDGGETTLFLAVKEASGLNAGKHHYLYLNESSIDETYGFAEIDSVVVDQLIVPPSDVFKKVEKIRELDTVNIAMTDYGFWDIEANNTNNVTYSYRNGKSYKPSAGSYNNDDTKLVTPTMGIADNSRFCEYSDNGDEYGIDRFWRRTTDEKWYECPGVTRYRDEIIVNDENLPFFRATGNFAVYDSNGTEPVHLLVNLSERQFQKLLFSDPHLTNYFVEWLYEQVTHTPPENGDTRGEWYLFDKYPDFIENLSKSMVNDEDGDGEGDGYEYNDLHFKLDEEYLSDGITITQPLSEKFKSVHGVIAAYSAAASTMAEYCTALNGIVNDEALDAEWLVDVVKEVLLTRMKELFYKVTWNEKCDEFVKRAIDALCVEFPLLEYFRPYLVDHIKSDVSNIEAAVLQDPQTEFTDGEEPRVVAAVRKYIESKVRTALVLGGYTAPETGVYEPNSCYPGIEQYIYKTQRKISRVQARDIMSVTNTLKEVMFAVQSTKFAGECDSFARLMAEKESSDLFKMTQNEDFVALSKLVESEATSKLNVDWSDVKEWMFESNPDNCSNEKMLKAFIRTQIYRPLFFSHDNYTNFTTNERAYLCTTDKYFVDHDGHEHEISPDSQGFQTDIKDELDAASEGKYEVDRISYFSVTNKFEYFINYNPVEIVDNKFVINDVEFYVVRPESGSDAVNSIYFNEFQSNTEGQNQVSKVTYDTTSEKYKFRLNGMDYVIEGNEISIDQATGVFDEDGGDGKATYKEWKCEIVDDRFQFDGTWYVLSRDAETDEYTSVGYADNKDNELRQIYVTPEGYAEYKPWEIQFQFKTSGDNAWNVVQVVKKHQTDVIDRLKTEECAFDKTEIELSPDKTYDWYIANELIRIQNEYGTEGMKIVNLGSGLLYNGALELTTKTIPPTECRIHIRNEVQNEDVVTICELVKRYGGEEYVQFMGMLFDRDMDLDTNRVFRGSFNTAAQSEIDETLVVKSGTGANAFFVKDIDKGLNNINTAWTDYSTWVQSHRTISDVANVYVDETTQVRTIQWNGTSDYTDDASVKFAPIYKLDSSGDETTEMVKYNVTIDDGLIQYSVWINRDYVHFVVNGNRYRMNLVTNKVDRLVVQDIHVTTVDFSTSYNPTQLRDNLAQNVKTTMLNKIAQSVIDSTLEDYGEIPIEFGRPIGLYLDLFTDSASLDNYIIANNGLDSDSDECVKFSQIYKNNLDGIDDSRIADGNVYSHLTGNIARTFGQKSNIFVVDSPSILVHRITQEDGHDADTFTYKVLMDVYIMQNKDWMKGSFRDYPNDYKQKYVIANAIVKDMECYVTITPKYSETDGSVTYKANYSVHQGKTYDVEYNQIVYNYNGKTKHMTTPEPRILRDLDFSGDGLKLMCETSGKLKKTPDTTNNRYIVEEIVSTQIKNIFTDDDCVKMFVKINNEIAETESTREVVDNSVVDNPDQPDSIWQLGVEPAIAGGELVSENRGWTYIRGQTYNVSDNDRQLIPTSGSQRYDIEDVNSHKYETRYIIEVLEPTTSGDTTTWDVKYLGSSDYSGDTISLVDDKSQAYGFDASNVHPGDKKTADDWIEQFVSGSTKYTRDNFAATTYLKLEDEYEIKKVATSEKVLVGKDYVNGRFTVNSMGSDENRNVFLSYKPTSGKPNRFCARETSKLELETTSLVNLGWYEKSIRVENTDAANAKNHVYLSTSAGYYSINPWLNSKINGRLITEYNGFEDKRLGPGLEPGGKFTFDIEWNNSNGAPEYVEKYITFGVKAAESQNDWDGLVGTQVTLKAKFTNLDAETPNVEIEQPETPCYSMMTIPDTRNGTTIADITEYTVYAEDVNLYVPSDGGTSYVFVDEVREEEREVQPVEGSDEEERTEVYITKTISFIPRVKVVQKKFALNLGSAYVANNGMYVNCRDLEELPSQYVIIMKDFGGNKVGQLEYGYAPIPMDIDDEADADYYETLLKEINIERKSIGLPEIGSTYDIPHKTTGEYEWSYYAYFELSSASGTLTLASDGKDWPVSLDVLPPGKLSDEDGQVFNRVYEVQTKVYADHVDFPSARTPHVWIDKASVAASISAEENKPDWKKLIYECDSDEVPTTTIDYAVPPRMRENVQKLISKTTYLDNSYFEMALTQLQTFLDVVANELHQQFTTSEISNLCDFKYYVKRVKFNNHDSYQKNWADPTKFGGLFGYARDGEEYKRCVANFNNHLLDEFKSDWRKLTPGVDSDDQLKERDYHNILDKSTCIVDQEGVEHPFDTFQGISIKRSQTLADIYGTINYPPPPSEEPPDIIDQIFQTWSNKVRFINVVRTSLKGSIAGMLVADDICNLFVETTNSQGNTTRMQWYTFSATKPTMDTLVDQKVSSDTGEFVFDPKMRFTQYPISKDTWLFKTLNRDFVGTSRISDAFAIHCDGASYDIGQALWYIPYLDVFVYGANSTRPDANTDGILDMVYEQYGNRLYVLFNGDNHLYAYDNIEQTKTFNGFVVLKKETAVMKLVTFNSMCITDDALCYDRMFLDYFRLEGHEDDKYHDWRISLYGRNDTENTNNKETWYFRPGLDRRGFQQYNSIVFGNSLFDEGQLRFHNISKNKDMYDILDINEVDGRYYGLFKNETQGSDVDGKTTYTVFKSEKDGGVVQRLPWQILNKRMYMTNDSLYSLYVVSNEPQAGETYHPVLREISVPDADEYPQRVLDISKLYKDNNGEGIWENNLEVYDLIMDEFKLKSKEGQFFALTNKGFHKVDYIDQFKQLSIDSMQSFRTSLHDTFRDTVLQKHMDEMHNGEQAYYFAVLKSKVNQFAADFSVFSLVPTEFLETQDVGVIPNSPVTDIDTADDHRDDSILTSTDIMWTDGLFAQSDTNPGIVTCAISNPATIYDDDSVFTKSQRNPSIEGTEFYDFINDQDGNTLLDLYAIPFIYRINTNNTYDLYINVPTTRTKYLNRVAGTLQDNGTSQVLDGDTRTRVNFLEEPMPNNLDESTTRLRVFMDKKYLSIGTIDVVEISGNSIPTQIYRDVPNNGLYDSLALESRWNGEVVQLDEPSKDINKVMLEFECYGTDSQSIHIQGKTFINRALNEAEYGTSESIPSDPVQRITLTFDPNGGFVDETTRTVVVGELIADLPTPTRAGYAFDGWWTSPTEGIGTRIYGDDDSFANEEWDTLYAHWLRILKSISIYGDQDVVSEGTSVYACSATFEDNSTEMVYPTWSASDGSIESNGRFTAPPTLVDKTVYINASYEDNGTVKETRFPVSIQPNLEAEEE